MAVLKRSLGLRTKVIVLIILIVGAVLSASTYLSVRMSEELLEGELKKGAITLAWELGAGIRGRGDLEDTPTMEREIEGVMGLHPLIELIDIFAITSRGLTLVASSSRTDGSPGTLKSVPQEIVATLVRERGGRLWDVVAPIRLGNEVAGALRVRISLKKVDELAARTRLQFSLIMGVAVVLIVAGLGGFFHRTVNRPIRELTWTMGRAEGGDLAVRVGPRAGDEIGVLGGSFNRMLNRIEEQYHQNVDLLQQINRFNEELKENVRLATQELEVRNEELRRANELLFNTQLKLSRSERLAMVGQLAATVAHEIGTPLTSISGHIQLVLQEPELDASTKSRLKIVEDQIARTVEILQGILKLTRPPEPALKPIDVNGPLREIIDLTSPGLGLKNVIVTTRLAADLPPVLGDAHQLQQVFLNLIVNALDAMPDGGELTVETDPVEPYVEQKNSRWVRVQIADTGYGVATDDQKRIFEPFFTTKDLGSGTGLGLAVCQNIIKAHGGTIELKSQVGRGTTLTILLPAQET